MAKNLLIVESPAKAKTIEKILGKDFIVKSSFGHVRDLAKKNLGIDTENAFEPNYEVSADKKKVVSELKKLVKDAEVVWLATDEDREGEAIAWHLYEVLNLQKKETKRIVFHEITKNAILNAVENPREIDIDLVNAQQARRVLDRLVGFEVSPVLWKKVKPSLSAGRVQSVAVRLIVEREEEIKKFEREAFYKVSGVFEVDGEKINATLNSRLNDEKEAKKFLEACIGKSFTVDAVTKKPLKRSPSAPFTTSTLQQEASRKLGFSVSRTMSVAQKLYEAGHITYMRTDSVNLSNDALSEIANTIKSTKGEEYLKVRKFKTKDKSAQEAHEAIRPTSIQKESVGGDAGQKRLYDLIWKRTLASQMAEAKLEKTTINIEAPDNKKFIATGEVVLFDGFLSVYRESSDDETPKEIDGLLPPVKQGMVLPLLKAEALQGFTLHPPRYNEASLVRKLEELGIGRPSTYAPTITTVQTRGYVVKETREGEKVKTAVFTLEDEHVKESSKTINVGAEKNKLFPTDIGKVVTEFLSENFNQIMDYNFTAKAEQDFDEIAEGKIEWQKMLADFYKPFHENVENTLEHAERTTGERMLGEDPKTGKPVSARIGRYGPMVQLGSADDEEKPKFASLKKGQQLEDITLEEALDLFKLPRTLGEYEGKVVTANIGRFGPYVRHDSKFVSLKKEQDPMDINLEESIELIEAKRKADKEKIVKTFEEDKDLQILKGRYGIYIAYKKKNYRIPKGVDGAKLTYEESKEIVDKAVAKKK
ncbi:DNA topoisomerase-1 [Balneicella halophila]|uniref:DNA topoisomerase 1 n=1 Tax=Balneicella halophila TaxID=1537566 RepID=A0A7L4USV3_BALHA|nr:type I DNA topoisomerase [Balneicella halophila]PVX52104.1 DNA topoisomerase-1 [Balneicella halophila]